MVRPSLTILADITPRAERHLGGPLVALLVMVWIALGGIGYTYHLEREHAAEHAAYQQIQAIGDLKAREIARWLKERQGDAATLLDSPFKQELTALLANPSNPGPRQRARKWLHSLARHYDYSTVMLLDESAQIILSAPRDEVSLDDSALAFVAGSLRTGQVVFSDLYGSPLLRLDFIVPLVADGSRSLGALLLRVDPHEFLFPLLQTWPTPSASGETLLVRREGDELVFLHPPRHHPENALTLRLPLNTPELPAARVIRGERGEMIGIDYRGVDVLAAVRSIPYSPWYLVAKVDRDEIFAPIRASALRTIVIIALLMLVVSLLAWIIWRHQHEVALRGMNQFLDSRVQARTVHLETLNRQLQQEIAERRQAETALAESQRRLQALFDNALDAILLADDAARLVDANPAAGILLGRSRQEILQMTVFDITPTMDRERGRVLWRAFTETDGKQGGEYPLTRQDGTILTVEYRAVANILPGLHLSILRDVTERKRAQELLQQQQTELTHVARLNLAGELATGLAHELNQPLTAIATYLDTCRDLLRSGQLDIDLAQELLEKAADQSLRAGKIIHHLRAFLRKEEPEPQLVDLNKQVEIIAHLVETEARHGETQVRLALTEPLPSVIAEPIQIQQVIMNLVRNSIEALRYVPTGDREVLIQTLRVQGDMVELVVTDTGPGLTEEALTELFNPFFTTKPNGMGLGLSISKSIVEAHGGRLWATPDPDQGVSFRFTLPCGTDRSSDVCEASVEGSMSCRQT